ncbi:MAG: hypothetical protein KDC98_17130, partial [Planctomycetes bacterium]|nr:hypothetical protein [Planctomycetota bacterium]
PLLVAPEVTASGALTTDFAWTGTMADGSTHSWPLGGVSTQVIAGRPYLTGFDWVSANTRPLTNSYRLYGISGVLKVPYPDYPRGLKPGDQFRILFVTDSTRDATSSNINDYDAFVTADAQGVPELSSFRTNWRAVASTLSVSAKVHTETDGIGVPIYRPDGTRVANDNTSLYGWGATLLAPPNVTASGAVTSATRVWTGTNYSGATGLPMNYSGGLVHAGNPHVVNYNWIVDYYYALSSNRPLYGISDVITVPEPKHPQDLQPGQRYRVLFVTDGRRDATSANITDYDDFVRADADAVPAMRLYDTEWRAVASTPSVSARVHTGTDPSVGGVPIYRPDGTPVANDYRNLWGGPGAAGALQALPNVTPSGAVTSASRVWSGTHHSGIASYPLGGSSGNATSGDPNAPNFSWILANVLPQTGSQPLYGISEVLFVPFPAEIGTSCGSATLSRDTLPVLGTSFLCTLSGVPTNGIGAVLVDLGLPTAGTPQPTPPFAVGCMSYLASSLTLGITLLPSRQFAVAIPNDTAYVGLPIAMQGAAIDLSSGEVTSTNAIAARVRD